MTPARWSARGETGARESGPLSPGIDWRGPRVDDPEILGELPASLREVIDPPGGFRRWQGGLHVRGACLAPEWNSLRAAWKGPSALRTLFPEVGADDIPFAQTALGDQWLLRGHAVLRLEAASARIEDPGVSLGGFLRAVEDDAVGFLGLERLVVFLASGATLAPGDLLEERGEGLAPGPAPEVLARLAGVR
ncbi:MAG: hypothetical protein ACQGVK_21700 [Myxococcota bacterium]